MAINKQTKLLVYDFNGNFLYTISNKKITSQISFTSFLGNSASQLNLTLAYEYGEIDILGKFIEVYVSSDFHPKGKLIFSGIARRHRYTFSKTLEVGITGIYSLLNRRTIATYKGDTVSGLVRYCFNLASEYYPNWSFNLDSVEEYTKVYEPSLGETLDQILQDINNNTLFDLFTYPDRTVKYGDSIGNHHILSIGKEIIDGGVGGNIEGLLTDVEYSGDVVNAKIVNEEAEAKYGNIKRYVIGDYSTYQEVTSLALDDIKTNTEKKEADVIVSGKEYDIDSIYPGDTVTITNTKILGLETLKIQKIDYNVEYIKIYFEYYDSFTRNLNLN